MEIENVLKVVNKRKLLKLLNKTLPLNVTSPKVEYTKELYSRWEGIDRLIMDEYRYVHINILHFTL